MLHARRNRPRLTAAVTAVLAVTAGTLAAGPAVAAPAARVGALTTAATAAEQAVVPFPAHAEIVSAGTTGFLSKAGTEYRWTRYATGTSTAVAQAPVFGAVSDVLATRSGDRVVKLQDMSTDAAPVEIDLKALGGTYTEFGAVGATLLTTTVNGAGATEVHLLSSSDGTVSNRTVTGLPADAGLFAQVSAVSGSALVSYATGSAPGKRQLAVVDLATGGVTGTYENARPVATEQSAALSATHVAWVESGTDGTKVVVVADRATGATQRTDVGTADGLKVALVGTWVAYGEDATKPHEKRIPFTAKSLGTDPSKKVLDHLTSVTTAPGGDLLVRGGSVADGEGLYRVSAGTGDAPVVELVASTGEKTEVTVLGHNIPAVIDLDKNRGIVPFEFQVNRRNVGVYMELAYPSNPDYAHWKAFQATHATGSGTAGITWDGSRDDGYHDMGSYGPARNGDYVWRASISPSDGVGPTVHLSGSLKIVRKEAPHDLTNNGSPDLFQLTSEGLVHGYDADYWVESNKVTWPTSSGTYKGWGIYDRFVVPGSLGGSPRADIVTRDKSGGLWVYESSDTGYAALKPRRQIGTNWGIYNQITGGSDLTGDSKPDLLATDRSGVLWLYPGTGNIAAPLGARKRIGGGWGVYNLIATTGNIGGAPAGDLVARDSAGVLWLYLGKGDGTFATRARIGGGWNEYKQILAAGDATRDGRPDLFGYNPPTEPGTGRMYVYEGTGDWRVPFGPRTKSFSPSYYGGERMF